jgi:hypothetical protein
VDLHPAGASDSQCNAAYGSHQFGYARIVNAAHASMWSGTAESWVDLHPSGASQSAILGAHGSQQVGVAAVLGNWRASLWNGTSQSWVNLNPPGATTSQANATIGTHQVGYARIDLVDRAVYWRGTAASWVDLHRLLPPEFTTSTAEAISTDGVYVYIAGNGGNISTGREEALLWVFPAGEVSCEGDVNGDGRVDGADLGVLLASWGNATAWGEADLNGDCIVNGVDLGRLLAAWGDCP